MYLSIIELIFPMLFNRLNTEIPTNHNNIDQVQNSYLCHP